MLTDFFLITIGAILVNNFVLIQFLGVSPLLAASSRVKTATDLALATSVVLILSSLCSHLIWQYLLVPLQLHYLRLIVFILVITASAQLGELVIAKTKPLMHRRLKDLLPLIITNCAILGVALLNIARQHDFIHSAFYSLGAALGFSLILVLFAAMQERVAVADIPQPFKGAAIGMITAGLVSLAFMGFAGLV